MKFGKTLVPVNGNEVDREALELACKIAKGSDGKVYVVYVIQVKRSLPLDAELEAEARKAEEILTKAEKIADEMDYEVETDLLQTREIGPAIVDEAMERGVDLIIMTISHKIRPGEFDLGGIAPYVLKNAPCHVLILFIR
jgi:nucleotide-binding universal stress UspA family protein